MIKPPIPDDFPNIFDNPFGRWISRIARFEEAHRVGMMVSLMAYLSAAIGGGPRITTIKGSLSLHFWPILCGISGGGGKGDATSAAKAIFDRALPGWRDVHEKAGFDTGMGIVSYMSEKTDENGKPLDLFVFESEVSRIISQMASDARMMTSFTKLFDRDTLTYMSGKERMEIRSPYAAILGHVQPKLFLGTKRSKATATGVWNRFLFFYVEREQTLDLFADMSAKESEIAVIGREIHRIYAFAKFVGNLKVPPMVAKRFAAHHRPRVEALTSQSEEVNSYAQRGLAYMLKVAALYAIWDGRDYLKVEDLDSALALVHYSVESIKYVLSSEIQFSGRTTLAKRVLAFIQQNGPSTWSKMRKHVGGDNDNMSYYNALIELEGQIYLYTLPTEGRRGHPGRYLATEEQLPPNAILLDPAELLAKLTGKAAGDGDVTEHPNYRVKPPVGEPPMVVEVVDDGDQLVSPETARESMRKRVGREAPEKPQGASKALPAPKAPKPANGHHVATRKLVRKRPRAASGITDISHLLK